MESIYLFILIGLITLAFADLIVGVSNDAVNFLNSAIGSKVLSFKTLMIVASIGVFVGCVFSSGMMEVARKGILGWLYSEGPRNLLQRFGFIRKIKTYPSLELNKNGEG